MLSKRLFEISKLVPKKCNVIDIGCDHALLDLYLAKSRNIKCIAIDIRENIINNVKEVVKKEKLENKKNHLI